MFESLLSMLSQTICVLKMRNLIRYDRLCYKCDNNKGMSKHIANIFLLLWKMFIHESSI